MLEKPPGLLLGTLVAETAVGFIDSIDSVCGQNVMRMDRATVLRIVGTNCVSPV
jgi:hypothetical protein